MVVPLLALLAPLAPLAPILAALACAPDPDVFSTLAPVPEPSVFTAEPLVRAQLAAERLALDELLATATEDPAQVGAAFGRMGQLYHAYDLL